MGLISINLILKSLHIKLFQFRCYSRKYRYEIPERYRNAFYLANASLEDLTNWFVHNALRVIYNEIIGELKCKGYTASDARRKIASILNVIEPCNNFFDIQFPVKRETGQYDIFRGFRAQHGVNIDRRPCLGGLRLCSKIEKSDIKALALISTYKYACMGIDMAGSYGSILACPKELEQLELQKVVETYTTHLVNKGFCGESVDVIEPDMSCGSNEIKWIIAANSKITGKFGNACAVGKPVLFGGIKNREEAVAQGIVCGLNLFLQNRFIMEKIDMKVGWKNKTFILQGLGSVGFNTAVYLENNGLKCVGIIEHDCHIYFPQGIRIPEATVYKNKHGSLDGFKSYTKSEESHQTLTANCDILVLAATEKSVAYHIADKITAKIIIEAANGPTSPSVYKILLGHDKLVLPDIYINSGSSIASYYEYLKNMQCLPEKVANGCTNEAFENLLEGCCETQDCSPVKSNVRQKIKLATFQKNIVTQIIDYTMKRKYKEIMKTANLYKLGLDFRTAAYINAIKKLFWTVYKRT